jgi:hypothetical protein
MTPLKWAAHYRQRAAECTELADNTFDPGIEAHYRTLAGRYIKLAEAEEDFAARHGRHDRLDWVPSADGVTSSRPPSRRGGLGRFLRVDPQPDQGLLA